jgi:hypothetical protein
VSRDHIEVLFGSILVGFHLGRRDVADGPEEAMVVEPIDPAQVRHFDDGRGRPRPPTPNHLGFVEVVGGFSEGVVTRVADAADRGNEIGLGQALGRRAWIACLSASSTNPAVALVLTFQLTMRRAKASITNAT